MEKKNSALPAAAVLLGLPLLAAALGIPLLKSESRPPPAPPRENRESQSGELSPALEPCADRARAANGRGYEVRYLIATIPDPADSLYPRLFDLHTAAVKRAMERLDYVEDGSCLPWQQGGGAAEKAADGTPLHRAEPGALLFRRDNPTGEGILTIVLLVGESPPWGVHSQALARALDYACLGRGWPAAGSPALLGPTFSASTASLGVAIRDWFAGGGERQSCFSGDLRILSGTATGTRNRETLENVLPPELKWSYRSLATPNDELQSCMLERFLRGRLGIDWRESRVGDRPSVALLAESSVYGRDFGAGLLVLPFPMHISNLRTAYEAQKAQAGGAAPAGGTDGQGRFLGLRADELPEARDAGRAFDVIGTTRSQELELAHILAVISRDRIQAVGIIATNIRDTLFLADALRRYAPDVRLFTFEADLLLAHPDYGAATRGMIVASSNPLLDPDPVTFRNGGASSGSRYMLQFANDTSQGVYEATKLLLQEAGTGELPPQEVWLSVVGNARLTPIERVELAKDSAGTCKEAAPVAGGKKYAPGRPPRGWSFLLSLLTGLILAILVHLVAALTRGATVAGGLVPRELLWSKSPAVEPLPRSAQRIRHTLLVMIPLATALPYLVLSGPVFFIEAQGWMPAVAIAGLLALAAAIAALLWGLARRTRDDLRGREPLTRTQKAATLAPLGFALVLFTLITAVAALAGSYLRRRPENLVLDLDRYIAFGSGVSPLLPCLLLLAVLMGWLVLTLWRYRTLELLPQREHLETPAPHPLPARLRQGLLALNSAVDPAGFFSWRVLTPGQAVAWSVLVLAPLLYLSFYYRGKLDWLMHGVDGRFLDGIVTVLFALGLVCAMSSSLALWQGWVGFRRSLSCLAELRFTPDDADGAAAEGPQWLKPIRDVDKSTAGAGVVIVERRDAAYERLVAELASAPQVAADLGVPARLEPKAAAVGASDFARLWVAIAAWATARSGSESAPSANPEPEVIGRARDYFAWQTALLSRESTSQLLKLLSFMTFGLLGIWLSVSVYPFEPERVLRFIVGGLIAAGLVVTVTFVVQMEKDPLLSHLHGTRANEVNWHRTFLQRLALYVGLPLLSLLTSQFPEVQRLVQQALEPAFKVLL